MRFIVYRTSELSDDGPKPCKKATRCAYTRIDEREANDPSKIPAYRNQTTDWWYGEGKNHRIHKGRIRRDFPGEAWCVNIESLDDMMKLYREAGSFMIEPHISNPDEMALQIVDDYLC